MATYSAVDGVVQDFHLVHLGARALGGAALVFVEMTSPSPQGRITPGCPGLWNDAQAGPGASASSILCTAKARREIGLQLGHSGPKGSTQVGWEAADEPLPRHTQLAPAGRQRGGLRRRTTRCPHAMTRADMDAATAQFVQATARAAAAGFDWLELHCAHGYLLSSFITPLTNLRTDEYGGGIARQPLPLSAGSVQAPCAPRGRRSGR
jgi:anthraniloyl-CoA monooxygenase